MRRAQYVSQMTVPEADVAPLTDADQDRFIREVSDHMVRDMRARVKDARPINDAVSFWVTGPHQDPLQGVVHVHNIAAWYDLDAMDVDAVFRVDYLKAHTDSDTGEGTVQ